MFNSDMIDVVIGLAFIYLLFSVLATAMRESLEAWLKSRGILLERGVLQLLTAPAAQTGVAAGLGAAKGSGPKDSEAITAEKLLAELYRSTPIFSLYQGDYTPPSERRPNWLRRGPAAKLPAYISAKSFAQGVIEVVQSYANPGVGGAPGSIDRLRLALEGVPNAPLRDAVRTAIQVGGGDPTEVSKYLETWFSSVMDRVSGWYRRHTQWWVLGGSLVVAIGLNVNTITIVQRLSENGTLRSVIAEQASDAVQSGAAPPSAKAVLQNVSAIRDVGMPIGWGAEAIDKESVWASPPQFTLAYLKGALPQAARDLPGWIMTALAISLGAPFWFDVLNKFMIVRSTVKPHEKSGEEGSKDPTTTGDGPDAASATARPPPVPPPAAVVAATSVEQAEILALDPAQRPREED